MPVKPHILVVWENKIDILKICITIKVQHGLGVWFQPAYCKIISVLALSLAPLHKLKLPHPPCVEGPHSILFSSFLPCLSHRFDVPLFLSLSLTRKLGGFSTVMQRAVCVRIPQFHNNDRNCLFFRSCKEHELCQKSCWSDTIKYLSEYLYLKKKKWIRSIQCAQRMF